MCVDASGEAIVEMNAGGAVDLEAMFHAQYERLARVIAGVIRDRARAEELAVEVFLKWSRHPKAHGRNADGWLYRTAIRTALNELRRETRRARYETLFSFFSFDSRTPTPEDVHAATETQKRVRLVLSSIGSRHAELLLLRIEGLSYDELATALDIHPASIGTLLGRHNRHSERSIGGAMEQNENTNPDTWINERLSALRPEAEWRPNTVAGFARLRTQVDGRRMRRRRLISVAAGIVAAVVLALCLPSTRAVAERYASACARIWSEFTGSRGTLVFTERRDRKLAPEFALNDASGTQVKLSDFRGKVVLLNLWDTECAPCNVEMPWFIEFQQTYGDRDFVVLSMALDKDGWSSIRPYIAENKVNHRVLAGTEDVAHLYGDSIPTVLIIDRSGRIAVTHVGLCTKREYETAIESTINER